MKRQAQGAHERERKALRAAEYPRQDRGARERYPVGRLVVVPPRVDTPGHGDAALDQR